MLRPLAAAIVGFVLVPAASWARPTSLGAGSAVIADGGRFAYLDRGEHVEVRDDTRGTIARRATVQAGCSLIAATAEHGLLGCRSAAVPGVYPRVFAPGMTGLTDVPGQPNLGTLTAIGKRWAAGTTPSARCCEPAYVNLVTGGVRRDLPAGLSLDTDPPARPVTSIRYRKRTLTLHEDGRTRVLDRNANPSGPTMAGRRVAWISGGTSLITGRTVKVFDLTTRNSLAIDIRRLLGRRSSLLAVAATRRAVYFVAATKPSGTRRIYRQAWPG